MCDGSCRLNTSDHRVTLPATELVVKSLIAPDRSTAFGRSRVLAEICAFARSAASLKVLSDFSVHEASLTPASEADNTVFVPSAVTRYLLRSFLPQSLVSGPFSSLARLVPLVQVSLSPLILSLAIVAALYQFAFHGLRCCCCYVTESTEERQMHRLADGERHDPACSSSASRSRSAKCLGWSRW